MKTQEIKKKFPSWFRYYSEPQCPRKPEEFLRRDITINTLDVFEYSDVPVDVMVSACNNGATHVRARMPYEDSDYIELSFYKITQIKNPRYATEYKKYEKKHKEYKDRISEWKIYKKEWDEIQKEQGLQSRKKMYEKLKKEFENEK